MAFFKPSVATATRSLARWYSSTPSSPRHLLTIADLTPLELATLVNNAAARKSQVKANTAPASFRSSLAGQSLGLTFSKRSTRTRISTEAAVAAMGGHSMFLGKDDIQLGVNESLRDTSIVMSSMLAGIVARVGPHSDVKGLAQYSSAPVINALSADYHPLQTIADMLTVQEAFGTMQGLKIAWVGDANNVLFDMAIGAVKLGIDIAVAAPEGYGIPQRMRQVIQQSAQGVPQPGSLSETQVPEEAVKGADILVTDTWVSMGQEEESAKRLKAFAGFQVTDDMAKRGGAKQGWKFMHCLPRHAEEVSDQVFYGERSLVFPEAENRLWAAISAIEAFVVNKGKIE